MGEERRLGRYEVVAHLGRGGMADVFLGRVRGEAGFEKLVVLKTLPADLALETPAGEALLREARLGERFDHPGIVQILDFVRDGATHFLVMEYVRGYSLRTLLSHARGTEQPLPIWAAVHVGRALLSALAYVHDFVHEDGTSAGLVHRDVSPDNILLSANGSIKLADFGVAKVRTALERTGPGILKGKYSYMAPEAIRSGTVDARFDLWSAGVVLYETLCLRRPLRGDDHATLLHAVLEGPIAPLREHRPDVTPALEAAIGTALERDPVRRWQRAQLFRAALDEAQPPGAEDEDRFRALLVERFAQHSLVDLAGPLPTPSDTRSPLGRLLPSPLSEGAGIEEGPSTVAAPRPRATTTSRPAGVRRRIVAAGVAIAGLLATAAVALWSFGPWTKGGPAGAGGAGGSGAATAGTSAGAGAALHTSGARPPAVEAPVAPLVFGITGARGADESRRSGEAIAAYLAARLERPVRAHVARDYAALGEELADGRVDAAWLPPLAYVRLEPRGVEALLVVERAGRPTYQAAWFVRGDAPFRTLADLARARARVGWVDRDSASGYLFPRAMLARVAGDPDGVLGEQRFLGSHEAVCRAVLEREVDAGATYTVRGDAGSVVQPPCEMLGARAAALRVLDWSAPIPGDTIAVRPGLADATSRALVATFVGMKVDEAGRVLLTSVFRAEGFLKAELALYDFVRELAASP